MAVIILQQGDVCNVGALGPHSDHQIHNTEGAQAQAGSQDETQNWKVEVKIYMHDAFEG